VDLDQAHGFGRDLGRPGRRRRGDLDPEAGRGRAAHLAGKAAFPGEHGVALVGAQV